MPWPTAQRFLEAFDALASGHSKGLDIQKLAGRTGYRLRIGNWRALYRVKKEKLIIEVIKIGPRGDIYK